MKFRILNFLNVWREGRKLARQVREWLDDDCLVWATGRDHICTKVNGTPIDIQLVPRCLPICEHCYLLVNNSRVFVPLLARLRLRTATRLKILKIASSKLEKKNEPKNEPRKNDGSKSKS